MENYNEACMQDMCEMCLFYTGVSVFCLKYLKSENIPFLFIYNFNPFSVNLGDFLLCLVFVAQIIFCVHASFKIENILKIIMKNY